MSQNPISGVEESEVVESSVGVSTRKRHARYVYNFNRLGGAVSTITLVGPVLPNDAIIKDAYIEVITPPTSGGGATIALGFESTTDVNAADAISGAPWSAAGIVDADGLELGTESGYIKLTSAQALRATIGTAALTAGLFYVFVEYDVGG